MFQVACNIRMRIFCLWLSHVSTSLAHQPTVCLASKVYLPAVGLALVLHRIACLAQL